MGGRYLVSGVQLGLIVGAGKTKQLDMIESLIGDITAKQYIGESQEDVVYESQTLLNEHINKKE